MASPVNGVSDEGLMRMVAVLANTNGDEEAQAFLEGAEEVAQNLGDANGELDEPVEYAAVELAARMSIDRSIGSVEGLAQVSGEAVFRYKGAAFIRENFQIATNAMSRLSSDTSEEVAGLMSEILANCNTDEQRDAFLRGAEQAKQRAGDGNGHLDDPSEYGAIEMAAKTSISGDIEEGPDGLPSYQFGPPAVIEANFRSAISTMRTLAIANGLVTADDP